MTGPTDVRRRRQWHASGRDGR